MRLKRIAEAYQARASSLEVLLRERENQLEAGRQEILILTGLVEENASKLRDVEKEMHEGKQMIDMVVNQNQILLDQLRDLQVLVKENHSVIQSLKEQTRKKEEENAAMDLLRQKEAVEVMLLFLENSTRIQDLENQLEESKRLALRIKQEEEKEEEENKRIKALEEAKKQEESLRIQEEEEERKRLLALEEAKEQAKALQIKHEEEEKKRLLALEEAKEQERALQIKQEEEEKKRILALEEAKAQENALRIKQEEEEEKEKQRLKSLEEEAKRHEEALEKERQEAAMRIERELMEREQKLEKLRKKAAARVLVRVMRNHLAAKRARQLEEDMALKKKRNDAINEKGLYRAFCRVKPFLAVDDQQPTPVVIEVEPANDIVRLMAPEGGQKSAAYMFDRVFGADSAQEDIFAEVEELVESALDGNNVCLMAYGQTGSGKSYTMQGTAQHPGIIPRAVEKLFDNSSRVADGWTFSFKVSAIQIYNNKVEDLLVPGSGPTAREMLATKKEAVAIPGLVEQKVSSAEELLEHFVEASGKRSTDSTAKNATSSRSHFVFHVDILGKRSGADNARGRLVFVDLAGSEAKNVAQSARQSAEGANIRSSLAALKTYLMHASKGNRGDSRSMRIVQKINDVLNQKDAKLLVIATISADLQSFSQSKEALEFLAVISRLKKYEQNSNAFEAAKRACENHDQAIGAEKKPWKRRNKEKSVSRKPKEDVFYFDHQSMSD